MSHIANEDIDRFADAIENANEKVRVRIYSTPVWSMLQLALTIISFLGVCFLTTFVVWHWRSLEQLLQQP